MTTKVLGIDTALVDWEAVGSAVIEFDASSFTQVLAPAIAWPRQPLSARALAVEIDRFARAEQIAAVAIDGPQGWRDPVTPPGTPGVGRRCEYFCRTQGKTGVYSQTYPANQRPWIEFCIELFDELLAFPGVALAEPGKLQPPPSGGYWVLECYPTSAWRSSGLRPLPGKARKPQLQPFFDELSDRFVLPNSMPPRTHDDLQAIVAALTAVPVAGGPATALPQGEPARTEQAWGGKPRRLEGFIWNVQPAGFLVTRDDSGPRRTTPTDETL